MKNRLPNFLLLATALLGCEQGKQPSAVIYSPDRVEQAVPFAPGVISTAEQSEFDLMFSEDGLTAWFSRRAPGEKQKIYETHFAGGQWSEAVVCPFSTDRDEAPSITPDGKYFFFGSERPIPGQPNKGNFDTNIWMMSKEGSGWSTPVPLPYPINDVQAEGEQWPSSNNSFLSAVSNGKFYYSTMVRGDSAIRLYEVEFRNNQFTAPVEIKGLFEEEKYWVYSPVVSPDGNYLVFNSFGAPGGTGGEDLFVSEKTKTGWSRARPMGAMVNTTDEEGGPRFSRDGKYFFFTRAANLGNYEYGEWDILYLETEFLQLDSLFLSGGGS